MNNPVNMDEPSGHWPRLGTMLTCVVAATVGAAASAFALAGGAALGGTSGVVASVAFATAGAIVFGVAKGVSDKISRREHTVYKLVDDTGKTQYVGRTKNPTARKNIHNAEGSKTAGLEFKPIASKLA